MKSINVSLAKIALIVACANMGIPIHQLITHANHVSIQYQTAKIVTMLRIVKPVFGDTMSTVLVYAKPVPKDVQYVMIRITVKYVKGNIF